MADKKISELAAITGSATAADDYFILVDTSGAATKKISRAELNNAIEADVLSTVNIDGGTIDGTVIGSASPSTASVTTLNTAGAVIFNDAGADVDFRVEGDADPHLIFADASVDGVVLGGSIGTQFNAVGGAAKLTVIGSSASTNVLGNTLAAMQIVNTDQTANNTAGLHFSRADTDDSPNYAGASIVSQFGETQATGQYPSASLSFLTSSSQNSAPSLKMTLTAAGLLGVGVAAPAKRIHIESSGNQGLRTIRLAYDGSYYNELIQGGAAGLQFNAVGGLLHTWAHNGTEIMRLNATGLGIGTSVPATALSVVGGVTVTGDITANNFAGRNKIIGGDFTTNPWQRGTSFAAIGNTDYFADRWRANHIMAGAITASKAADAPTAAQAGIYASHCLSLAVTTADTSIAAADFFAIQQLMEGLNVASFGFGQAGSRNVTLSFWVKGTKTGIHCVSIRNSANNRQYAAEYTIDSTNTWEYKTITIPVDITGTWLYDTGQGVVVSFLLAAGTNYHITANTWTASSAFSASTSNQVNALDSTSNIFKIALVQLEAGSVATTFDARSVGTELALCQRYYQLGVADFRSGSSGAEAFVSSTKFIREMRAIPTTAYTAAATAANVSGTPSLAGLNTNTLRLSVSSAAGGDVYYVRNFSLSAEL